MPSNGPWLASCVSQIGSTKPRPPAITPSRRPQLIAEETRVTVCPPNVFDLEPRAPLRRSPAEWACCAAKVEEQHYMRLSSSAFLAS